MKNKKPWKWKKEIGEHHICDDLIDRLAAFDEKDRLTAYKGALFRSGDSSPIGGDGVLCGFKVGSTTLPLPDGVIGIVGCESDPEQAKFMKTNPSE